MTADTDQPTLAVLKPCPFCGGDAYPGHTSYSRSLDDASWADGSPILKTYRINCGSCGGTAGGGVIGGSQTPERAITAWNTRTTHEPRPAGEALERLQNAVDHQISLKRNDPNDRILVRRSDIRVLACASADLPPKREEVGLREALEGFIADLTDNGRNRGSCLSVNHDSLNARIAFARAALATHSPAPMAGEWQPIATVDRVNGQRLILAWDDCPALPYHWEVGRWSRDKGWVNTYGHAFAGEPTHWMEPTHPAAAHPSTQEGADRG